MKHPCVEDDVDFGVAQPKLGHASRLGKAASDRLEHLLLGLRHDVHADDILQRASVPARLASVPRQFLSAEIDGPVRPREVGEKAKRALELIHKEAMDEPYTLQKENAVVTPPLLCSITLGRPA